MQAGSSAVYACYKADAKQADWVTGKGEKIRKQGGRREDKQGREEANTGRAYNMCIIHEIETDNERDKHVP